MYSNSLVGDSNQNMAARTASEAKMISLKILIDTKSNKVVFAEAGKDFVDFIFHMMSLPLSTVVKLLNEKGMVGCLGDLHIQEYRFSQFTVLRAQSQQRLSTDAKVSSFGSDPLLSIDNSKSNTQHNYGTSCSNVQVTLQGYVKEAVAYMVMDNLEVKPMSISLVKSHAKDFDSLEERQVQVGLQEVIHLHHSGINCHVDSVIFWLNSFYIFE